MEETTTMEETPVHFGVGGWTTISGAQDVRVVLAPEGEHERDGIYVYTWNCVGAGTPEPVWHGRHRVLCRLSVLTDAEALEEALRERIDALRAVAAEYRGRRWDGHNFVGEWGQEGEDPVDVEDRFALDLGPLPTRWDAGDWFGGDPNAVVEQLLEQALDAWAKGEPITLRELAEREVEEARVGGGVLLDLDDACGALERLLTAEAEGCDPDEPEDAHRAATCRAVIEPHTCQRCGETDEATTFHAASETSFDEERPEDEEVEDWREDVLLLGNLCPACVASITEGEADPATTRCWVTIRLAVDVPGPVNDYTVRDAALEAIGEYGIDRDWLTWGREVEPESALPDDPARPLGAVRRLRGESA